MGSRQGSSSTFSRASSRLSSVASSVASSLFSSPSSPGGVVVVVVGFVGFQGEVGFVDVFVGEVVDVDGFVYVLVFDVLVIDVVRMDVVVVVGCCHGAAWLGAPCAAFADSVFTMHASASAAPDTTASEPKNSRTVRVETLLIFSPQILVRFHSVDMPRDDSIGLNGMAPDESYAESPNRIFSWFTPAASAVS